MLPLIKNFYTSFKAIKQNNVRSSLMHELFYFVKPTKQIMNI